MGADGSEAVETSGERCGACSGGGMDALEASGTNPCELDGRELLVLAPAPEVEGREPAPPGSASAGEGVADPPGSARPDSSLCGGRSIARTGPPSAMEEEDVVGRAFMLPGWVK